MKTWLVGSGVVLLVYLSISGAFQRRSMKKRLAALEARHASNDPFEGIVRLESIS